jgi:hypothetical protein
MFTRVNKMFITDEQIVHAREHFCSFIGDEHLVRRSTTLS